MVFYFRHDMQVYASDGDRTRTYRVTIQDDPTTPQRHTFKTAQIITIYNTTNLLHPVKEEKVVASVTTNFLEVKG